MHRDTPLRHLHEQYVKDRLHQRAGATEAAHRPGAASAVTVASPEIDWLPYGPADADRCEIVGTYGKLEAEYAAIRRGAALIDCPQRGTLVIGGADRTAFLQRMVTADLKSLTPGILKRAFWLNRKGRIDADMRIVELGDRMFVDLDLYQTESAAQSLAAFIVADDVEIRNATDDFHRIVIHGPEAIAVIRAASGDDAFVLGEDCASRVTIADVDVVVARSDETGTVGLHLFVPRASAETVWTKCAAAQGTARVRPAGWHAYNIARIEAGTPLFNVDFGTDSLPHETGVLRDRVSFTKGCYLGQEIVARMESLGQPKQMLVGLKIEGELLPVAGGQVFAIDSAGGMGEQVGAITSSTLSPMLGAAPIAFAVVRTKHATLGTRLLVNAEGAQTEAVVHALRFLQEAAT